MCGQKSIKKKILLTLGIPWRLKRTDLHLFQVVPREDGRDVEGSNPTASVRLGKAHPPYSGWFVYIPSPFLGVQEPRI